MHLPAPSLARTDWQSYDAPQSFRFRRGKEKYLLTCEVRWCFLAVWAPAYPLCKSEKFHFVCEPPASEARSRLIDLIRAAVDPSQKSVLFAGSLSFESDSIAKCYLRDPCSLRTDARSSSKIESDRSNAGAQCDPL